MKKSDLKTGMVVELRRGDKAWVLKDTTDGDWIQWGNSSCLKLEDYNNDLTYSDGYSSAKFDIIKVYQPRSYQYLNNNSINNLELIYERRNKQILKLKVELEGVEEIEQIFSELEDRLKNMKVNLKL